MKTKTLLFIWLALFISASSWAQPALSWEEDYSVDSIKYLYSTISIGNNQFFAVGEYAYLNDDELIIKDACIVKTNNNNNITWVNTYGGSRNDEFRSIIQVSNHYYAVGSTWSNDGDVSGNHGGKDGWIVKLDSNGTIINQKCIGGGNLELFKSINVTNDNNLILTGFTFSYGHGQSEAFIVKIDTNLNIIWSNTYGGSLDDSFNDIKELTSGNFIAVGATSSYDYDVTDNIIGRGAEWVVKLTPTGNIIWSNTYGIEGNANECHSICLLNDSSFVTAGYNYYNGKIAIIDTNGIGKHEYYNSMKIFRKVIKSFDGKIIIAGSSPSNGYISKLDTNLNDIWNIYNRRANNFTSIAESKNLEYIVSGFHGLISFYSPFVDAGTDDTICYGDSTVLTAIPSETDFAILWSTADTTASITVSPTMTTTYYVTASKDSVSLFDTVIVYVGDVINTDAGDDISICLNSSDTLTASGGSSYSWSNGETTASIVVNPTVNTRYFVTMRDFNCVAVDSVMVTVMDLPIAYAGEDVSTCKGDSVELIASGGAPYSWSTMETDSAIYVAPIVITTYTVTTTHNNGCTASDDVVVNTFTASAGNDQTICLGTSATLVATGGGTYSWSTGATTSTIVVSPTVNTSYSVTVTNNVGCTDDASITVIIGCARPSNITLTGVSYNYTLEHYQINLAWDAIVCANNYYLYRRKVGDSTWTAQVYSTNLPAFYADSNATYECFSRTICVSSDTSISSDTIQFTTPTNPSCHDNKPSDLSAYYCNITQYATFMWTGAIDCYDSIGFNLFWRDSTITDTSWFSTNPLAGTSQISKKVSPTCIWKIREKYNNNYPAEYKLFSDFSAKIVIDTVGGCSKSYKGNFTVKIPNTSGDLVSEINAFPNPFNSQMNISYSLNENTNVRIEVYDIMGQKITTVGNELQQAGEHNIPFSVNASHGVYILKLSTPTKIFQTRIIKME